MPGWFDSGLRMALNVLVAFGVLGMSLAMAGAFRPLPVALVTIAGAAALWWASRGLGPERHGGWSWTVFGALALAVASAAFNSRWSSQHLLADRDPGVYMWHGRWIAATGNLLVDSDRTLFEPLLGPLSRHCPTSCPGAPGDRLYVQFLHFFPLTLAAAQWAGGASLMVKANALLGGFSLVCFFAFATRLVRPLLALAAAAAVAVDLVHVHFARDSVSEVLAQALLFGGLYLLWQARRRWDPLAGAVAGLTIGATCMVRIDSFFYLIPLAAYLFGEVAVSRERGRFVAAVAGGLAVSAALGFADLYFFSRSYFHFESDELRAIGVGLALTLLAGPAILLVLRRRPSPRHLADVVPLAIVALALFAAFVRPGVEKASLPHAQPKDVQVIAQKQREQGLAVEPRRSYAEHSFVWLDWYLGAVALAAGVAGLALMSRLALLGRAGPAVPFLGVFLATALLYVWRPSIFPDQVWAMRRFLPVVIPGFLLLAAWTADRLLDLRLPRPAGALLAAAVVAGSLAVPLAELAPLRSERQQAGAVALMRRICEALPPHAAVVVAKSPNYNDIVQPVHAFCRVPVATIYRPIARKRLEALAPGLRRSGHTLVLLATSRIALQHLAGPRAPRQPLAEIDYRVLEQRITTRPRRRIRQAYRVYMVATRD